MSENGRRGRRSHAEGTEAARLSFETAIIERYRRRVASVEEALVEMYLAGVSVRRVENITERPWGSRVSSGTVLRLNHKIYAHIRGPGVTGRSKASSRTCFWTAWF